MLRVEARDWPLSQPNGVSSIVCVSVSVPISEALAVEEGQVEIQPQKKVNDTDRDFTCKFQPGDADLTPELA